MSQTGAALLVTSACLLAISLFGLVYRRDVLAAAVATAVGFLAVATGLVGFAGARPAEVGAAQLEAFAILIEILGALAVAVIASLAIVLRRHSGGDELENAEVVGALSGLRFRSNRAQEPGERGPAAPEESLEPEPVSAEDAGQEEVAGDSPGASEPSE